MIQYIEGTVHHIGANSIVVVTYGVGRHIFVPPTLARRVRHGMEVALNTELVVREDSLTLFGFDTLAERDLFGVLLSASGVGPKVALAMLSTMTPEQIHQALGSENAKALTVVPGVGPKLAAKIMLDLKGKLTVSDNSVAEVSTPLSLHHGEVVDALVGLGWKQSQAEATVADVAATMPQSTVPELLKACLRELGGQR